MVVFSVIFQKLKSSVTENARCYDSIKIQIKQNLNGIKSFKLFFKRDNCISMFISALFTIAKLWNQQRCPTTNE
jgi:hypothetical protein